MTLFDIALHCARFGRGTVPAVESRSSRSSRAYPKFELMPAVHNRRHVCRQLEPIPMASKPRYSGWRWQFRSTGLLAAGGDRLLGHCCAAADRRKLLGATCAGGFRFHVVCRVNSWAAFVWSAAPESGSCGAYRNSRVPRHGSGTDFLCRSARGLQVCDWSSESPVVMGADGVSCCPVCEFACLVHRLAPSSKHRVGRDRGHSGAAAGVVSFDGCRFGSFVLVWRLHLVSLALLWVEPGVGSVSFHVPLFCWRRPSWLLLS